MLQEKHLRRAGLVGKASLRVFTLFTAEWWIHENHIVECRGALEEPTVNFRPSEGVAMPDVGFINVMQHEIGERYGVYYVVFLSSVECAAFERCQLIRRFDIPVVRSSHVLEGLGVKASRS